MLNPPFYQPALNYLVPASGTPRSVTLTGVFTAVPAQIDWNALAAQFSNFFPQGVFVDNSLGTGPLTINWQPLNFNIVVPAGVIGAYQYPAAMNETCTVTGNGQATCVFVDFPVLPSVSGTTPVAITSPNPLPVTLAVTPAFTVTAIPTAAVYASVTAAGATNTPAPPANTYLRKLSLGLAGNASLAAAGVLTITASLNGVQIYKRGIYLPAASPNTAGAIFTDLIEFETVAPNVGAAGNLTINLSAALATGALDVNAYFD